jgi:hypothetical protein
MITTSAFLALALQCSASLSPASFSTPRNEPHTSLHSVSDVAERVLRADRHHLVYCNKLADSESKAVTARRNSQPRAIQVSEADLNTILPSAPPPAYAPVQPATSAPAPTYERWDVLRQYPRYLPPAPPATPPAPASKPQDTQKQPRETHDA